MKCVIYLMVNYCVLKKIGHELDPAQRTAVINAKLTPRVIKC